MRGLDPGKLGRQQYQLFRIKMGPELIFGNKPGGLPENSQKCADIQLPMSGNCEGVMLTIRYCTPQLYVTPTLGMYGKTEMLQDLDNFAARQPF